MKNSTIKLIRLLSLVLFTTISTAHASDIKIINISNPTFSNGIQMGDVLNRSMVFEVDSIYQLPKTSLPIKGERRNEIELRDVDVNMTKDGRKNVYKISLSYQIFSNAAKPVIMALPNEHIALTGGANNLSINIPAWKFWYSPLVAEGVLNAKDNLQPQVKPTLIDLEIHNTRFWVSVSLLIMGLIGLVYVNADKPWLPFMGGEFAKAHRNIKRLKKDHDDNKNAFTYIHHAFNRIYGANVFITNLDSFLASHPKYLKLRNEINHFFEQSNKVLFTSQNVSDQYQLQHLVSFSKRLRDCERGI